MILFDVLGVFMCNYRLFFILATMINLSFAMDFSSGLHPMDFSSSLLQGAPNSSLLQCPNCCHHVPLICCTSGKIYKDGPYCCCCYNNVCCDDCDCCCCHHSECTDVYGCCCHKCCCNLNRCGKGCDKQICCSDEYEGTNLMFLLTLGCFGGYCLDPHGHIIPCTGAAKCFIGCCPCCTCMHTGWQFCPCCDYECDSRDICLGGSSDDCKCLCETGEYTTGLYNICSNTPICCFAALAAAKYGYGIPIPMPDVPCL